MLYKEEDTTLFEFDEDLTLTEKKPVSNLEEAEEIEETSENPIKDVFPSLPKASPSISINTPRAKQYGFAVEEDKYSSPPTQTKSFQFNLPPASFYSQKNRSLLSKSREVENAEKHSEFLHTVEKDDQQDELFPLFNNNEENVTTSKVLLMQK